MARENEGGSKPLIIHCHNSTVLDMSENFKKVKSAGNFIRAYENIKL